MNTMAKKFMTFKHWKSGEVETIEFRDAEVPANPNSERLVVWNADKASTAKNKNSPIAISAWLSVNSTPANKWVRVPSPRVWHRA